MLCFKFRTWQKSRLCFQESGQPQCRRARRDCLTAQWTWLCWFLCVWRTRWCPSRCWWASQVDGDPASPIGNGHRRPPTTSAALTLPIDYIFYHKENKRKTCFYQVRRWSWSVRVWMACVRARARGFSFEASVDGAKLRRRYMRRKDILSRVLI
jgi:hypothetical protein